jgi:hypothetical protein
MRWDRDRDRDKDRDIYTDRDIDMAMNKDRDRDRARNRDRDWYRDRERERDRDRDIGGERNRDPAEIYADRFYIPWKFVQTGLIPRRICIEGSDTWPKFILEGMIPCRNVFWDVWYLSEICWEGSGTLIFGLFVTQQNHAKRFSVHVSPWKDHFLKIVYI